MSIISGILSNPWLLVLICAIADSYAVFIIKLKLNKLGSLDTSSWNGFWNYILELLQSPLILSAILAYISAPAIWFICLSKLELSIAYPVLVVLHLLFIPLLGILFLKEPLSLNKIMGISLIFLSLYFFYKN
jgi:multidrug transporter EmrE-like cation transporter